MIIVPLFLSPIHIPHKLPDLRRDTAIAALLAAALGLVACCSSPPPRLVLNPKRFKGLPASTTELLALSDRLLAHQPLTFKEADRGLAALEKALKQIPARQRFEVYWKLARACFWLTEIIPEKERRWAYGRQGRDYAGRSASLRPRRVEPHYYRALNISKVAEATANRTLIKPMVAEAEIAARIDPSYDDAGPLRFLGKVYIAAPAWPVSIGSSEKALEYLQKAVQLAPVPLNRLFLGEAYYHEEEYDRAREIIQQAVRDGRKTGKLDRRWLQEGEDYLERIKLEALPTSQLAPPQPRHRCATLPRPSTGYL